MPFSHSRAIVSDVSNVYWANSGTTASNGQLVACDPTSTTPTVLENNLEKPVGLAIDSKAIYYGTTSGTPRLWRLARQ